MTKSFPPSDAAPSWLARGQLITDGLPDVGVPAGMQGPVPGQIELAGDVGGWAGRRTGTDSWSSCAVPRNCCSGRGGRCQSLPNSLDCDGNEGLGGNGGGVDPEGELI